MEIALTPDKLTIEREVVKSTVLLYTQEGALPVIVQPNNKDVHSTSWALACHDSLERKMTS